MGLAPSANGENPGKTAFAKVPVPIFSQPPRDGRTGLHQVAPDRATLPDDGAVVARSFREEASRLHRRLIHLSKERPTDGWRSEFLAIRTLLSVLPPPSDEPDLALWDQLAVSFASLEHDDFSAAQRFETLRAEEQPSDCEQYLLELINRGRSDPAAEAIRFGTDLNAGLPDGTISSAPKQPLGFSPPLIAAAREHSRWMSANDIFSHTGQGGSDPGARMVAAGYAFGVFSSWAENISRSDSSGTIEMIDSIARIHAGLYASPLHRKNQMNPGFRETGLGVIQAQAIAGTRPMNSLMVTEKFAWSGNTVLLTGVVYKDSLVLADRLYTPGEGVRGVVITAIRNSDWQVFATRTWNSGGYTLPVECGVYTIVARGGLLDAPVVRRGVTADSENIKVDFRLTASGSGND
jgi:hypothetical protein